MVDISSAMDQFKDATVGYLKKRVSAGISKKMLLSDTPENRDYIKNDSQLTEFRFLPKGINIPSSIQTYEEKVTILTLTKNKKIGFIIEDKDFAETMQGVFDTIWSLSEPTHPSD